ncbi:hypothetical protein G7Z17_g4807 [Cylindrodendrum hubeiense]|uniref:Rhodopsin domain-containing protein n=1 Tax=Cylindrodendrum hubeiense TaxID=595255 RepID=A0A9P5LI05_9HYPO|nr:hypothetical protein G7Z17_g4807 [Cylindrodendrum hubeiense]
MSSSGYMMEPPGGEDRWAAGTMATTQQSIGAVLFTFATVIYGLRIYTRVHLTNRPLNLSGVSLVSCWIFYGCTIGSVQWTIPVNIFYMLSSDLAKISLLFFYLRLCPERNFRILVQSIAMCFVLYAVIYALISIFGCQPIYASWDVAAQETGTCVDKFRFFLAASVANVVMDLIILLLPLRIVVPLQISRRQKASLLLLFATGSFVIIVAIYNCILTVKLFKSANYTWGLAYELSWMYAELTGCVICASASSLKPFFVRFIPGLFNSRVGGYSGNSTGDISKGSHPIRSRRQRSRTQPDAIELESGDDSESGRKVGDDDEAKLWSRSGERSQGTGCTVQVSATRKPNKSGSYMHDPMSSDNSISRLSDPRAINIVSTTEVLIVERRTPSSSKTSTSIDMAFRRLTILCAAASLGFGNAAIIAPQSDQKPIAGPDDVPIVPDHGIAIESVPNEAKIVLYPASRTYPDDRRDMGITAPACSDNDITEVIHLAPDVCLSGEYYMRDNFKVLESPSCGDGSPAALFFYQNRRCTGSPRKVVEDVGEATGRCLWSEEDIPISSYYWSLVYRCNAQLDGAPNHQEASPPLLDQNVRGAPGSVRHHHGTMFPCHSDFANNTHTMQREPGNCFWPISSWKLETIEITAPAVCSNGTRAQLAIYEDIGKYRLDYMCNGGKMTLENAIMDLDDWMLNTCINMSHLRLLRGGFGRALGIMFYCDGMRTKDQPQDEGEPSEPRGPRTSHSECAISTGRWQWDAPVRPKTFMYPEPMACVTLPAAHQLRIHEKPTCSDGTTGKLAIWKEPGCMGWPKKIQAVNTLNCENWNLGSESSYMIWCASEGLTAEDRKGESEDNRAVISTDDCPRLNLEPGWTVVGRDDGPTIRRVDADQDCVSVYKDDQLKVYGNAKCANGKDAKLVKYRDSYCRGKAEKTVRVASSMDTCTQICEGSRSSCGIKFSCDGQ